MVHCCHCQSAARHLPTAAQGRWRMLLQHVHGLCSRVKGLCRGGSAPMRGPPVLEGAGGEEVGGVAELRPPPPLLPPLLVPGTPDPPPGTPGPPSLFRPLALALSVTWSAKSWTRVQVSQFEPMFLSDNNWDQHK
ncbi:hypothetical protein E2C01_015680 [Portunus trituberculatus]|uniref:Uncharacterized protein n=1 Tax=Portunus trituberculatus TaxID=210409 RepID=A0A5B7DMJ7_PORTR|nr:hypothetical protein [Portunus trituberculatus]